jgi:hypothetical protein
VAEPHDCTNHIDVRFAGADDSEGETYCTRCDMAYEADELRDMHAALQVEQVERAA